jgi:hypothetical protein
MKDGRKKAETEMIMADPGACATRLPVVCTTCHLFPRVGSRPPG